jgi:NitT/TauT family transport system ATP-binding protein
VGAGVAGSGESRARAGVDAGLGPMSALGFECRDVSRVYPIRYGTVTALDKVSFRALPEEFLCIVGPSGCGKTTLLKIIAGLLAPTSGSIEFTPPELYKPGRSGRPPNGLVFQDHGVFPWMSVLDNVAFGLEMQGVPRKERHERARAFTEQVGLSAFADSFPHELSVGMRQRVGIARAFVANVPLLLMDEPFGSLDAQTRRVLQDELLRIWRDHRKLVVFVTHDIEEAVLLGDRILVMSGRPGRILEEIPVPLERPRDLMSREKPDVSELRWHIWRRLEHDVRSGLSIGS